VHVATDVAVAVAAVAIPFKQFNGKGTQIPDAPGEIVYYCEVLVV
jgi:hypothetical protein